MLSKTNALDVADMRDLDAETMLDRELKGHVLGLNGETIDQLRAMEAFKVSQGWGMSRRPATLVREETLELAEVMAGVEGEKKVTRQVLSGERGTGKSLLLLQAQAMAFRRDWIVISIPECTHFSLFYPPCLHLN